MTKRHLLIGINEFTMAHIEAIARTVDGWATWERIDEKTLGPAYTQKLSAAEMVIGWPEVEWLLASPVKLLLLPSAGYEAYLSRGLEARPNFTLCNARGVYSVGAAEHCIAMLLALARRLPRHVRAMRDKSWNRGLPHGEITGTTACIVGLGDIGTEIARRCIGLGINALGVRRDINKPSRVVAKVFGPNDLREAVAEADHIFSALPGGQATLKIFNREVFDAMKTGAYFYNVGRGSVVDESELIRHLQGGHLAGAGLDVLAEEPLPANNPLWTMENVIITPHIAGYAARYADRLCHLTVRILANYREGKPLGLVKE